MDVASLASQKIKDIHIIIVISECAHIRQSKTNCITTITCTYIPDVALVVKCADNLLLHSKSLLTSHLWHKEFL